MRPNLILYLCSLTLCFWGAQPLALAQINEGFEGTFPPVGWTVFDNGKGLEVSWEKGTIAPNSGNGHAVILVDPAADQAVFPEDWLVTPRLAPDAVNNKINFAATDLLNSATGITLRVGVSTTSQTDINLFDFNLDDTFSEIDFPVGTTYGNFEVDLSAYIGQEIYVAFVVQGDSRGGFLMDDVTGPPLVTAGSAPNCDVELTNPPADDLNAVPIDVVLEWSAATGDPTGYKLQIGTTQGGTEVLALTDLGNTNSYTPASDLAYGTRYYLTIIPYNGIGDASGCEEFEFVTELDLDVVLDCNNNETADRFFCYENDVTEEFTISSNNGDEVNILFNTGSVENNQDEIYIYDGSDDTGTLLNEGQLYGNLGSLAGLTYTSTTGSLFIRLTPDGSIDCSSGDVGEIDFTVSCAGCIPPEATVSQGNCDVINDQFFIDVNVTSLGTGSLTLTNDQNASVINVLATGVVQAGPFDFGFVTLTLENSDPQCKVVLPPVGVGGCPPANDDCTNAAALTLSPNETCANAVSGTTLFSTISSETGICQDGSYDVWYSFTATNTVAHVFELTDAEDIMSIAVYSGTCAGGLTLVNQVCLNEGRITVDLTASTTYLVQVFTDVEQSTGAFDLCVFESPAPPANDLCANATVLNNAINNVVGAEDITFATDTDASACDGAGVGRGVWYRIPGNDECLNITVDPADWDAAIQVWSGTCGNLTCEISVDEEGFGGIERVTTVETVSGTDYYIYVGATPGEDLTGVFDMEVRTCPISLTSVVVEDETCIGANNGEITVNATAPGGASDLEYSIDGGSTFQNENVFDSLAAGTYTIIVRQKSNNSCDKIITREVAAGTALCALLSPNIYLQGPFNAGTGQMTGGLTSGVVQLPVGEPYSNLGYNFVKGGGESTTNAILAKTGSTAIEDWVIVEIRHPNTPENVLESRAALLRVDGKIVSAADGTSAVEFTVPIGQSYHVAIRHRNHLNVMTAEPVPF